MCGVAGVLNLRDAQPISDRDLRRMILALRHRGPDEFGIYRDGWVGLACARLSIVDLADGQQPISNEDGNLWIVFNGEIFNHIELRSELEARGHRFSTRCDTEVVVHLFEEYGPDCLNRLNGQFAFALWNAQERGLLLARDRLGERPLYYTQHAGQLIFGSEIKAMLGWPGVSAHIDPVALRHIFTYWSPLSPNTVFRGISEVPPGSYVLANDEGILIRQYWSLEFTEAGEKQSDQDRVDELKYLLSDATRIRLRADVPVGAYLSGGLDSSITAAIIQQHTNQRLDTFSVAFSDPNYTERPYQQRAAQFLGTDHHELFCTHGDIGRVFPDVIWHTEQPILRTAPAPMFLLSKIVHTHQYKVVLTGEGADELLCGYDIFKEMAIRRFWARIPSSKLRPMLFRKLYSDIPRISQNASFLTAFFGRDLKATSSPFYSHHVRWANTSRSTRFLGQLGEVMAPHDNGHSYPIPLPEQFKNWSPLAQAQYLEITTFLSPYLLSSQSDRVSMAHSVEGRHPFLDYRVVEYCNRLPARVKLNGLSEKWLLRQLGQQLLPAEIWRRPKRPYRAPIQRSFFTRQGDLEYVRELLSRQAIVRSGLFSADAVEMLATKAAGNRQLSEIEEMALVGILSTQLVDQHFVRREGWTGMDTADVDFKLVDRTMPVQSVCDTRPSARVSSTRLI